MKACVTQDWKVAVQRFLFSHRITAHATTACTPSEMLISRTVSIRRELLRPSCKDKIVPAQEEKIIQDQPHTIRALQVCDLVWTRDSIIRAATKWAQAKVIEVLGIRNYIVETAKRV